MSDHVLQTVLFPSEQTCTIEELFFLRENDSISYRGYFNILSCRKWSRYTVVNNVYLDIEGEGGFSIAICSEQGEISRTAVKNGQGKLRIPLPDMKDQSFIWFEFIPDSKDSRLISAAYTTDQEPVQDIRLAADICTYRREAYVKRNLSVLNSAILENRTSPVYDKLDVFLVDNGKTLDAREVETDHISLFPNINAGGSGGFTRGILEILDRKQARGYTHMIFLDDDAVLVPDAFVRCYAILSYLKKEYRDSCVGGALLDEDVPYLQQEAGAYYNNGRTSQAKAEYDLRDFDTVIRNEEIARVDYAGWWWACFPLTFVREDNLPLPFFLHYDDIEYSLRNNKEIIYLNGICVWHSAPQKHRAQSSSFYDTRNRLVTDAYHNPDKNLHRVIFECINEAAYSVMRYQYGTADMVLQAVKDYLSGPESFAGIDPVKRNDLIRGMADSFQPINELTEDPLIRDRLTEYCSSIIKQRPEEPKITRRKYLFTLNGWFFPAKKVSVSEPVYCNLFGEDLRELYRVKRAILTDPYSGKGAWVEKSYAKALHSLWCMIKVWWLLLIGYRRSAEKYRKAGRYLTGEKMWKDYLGLD